MADNDQMNPDNSDQENEDHINIQFHQYSREESVSLIENLDIVKVMCQTEQGRAIIEGYNNSNPHQLPRKNADRKFIRRVVIDAGLKINPGLGVLDCLTLTRKICDTFKTEKQESYFQITADGRYKGTLWNYCKNTKAAITGIKKITSALTAAVVPHELEPNVAECKAFLDENTCEPWNRVEDCWRTTSEIRRKELSTPIVHRRKKKKQENGEELPLEKFINNWASLKNSEGYKLVKLDFNIWYPEAAELTEEKIDQLIYKLGVLHLKKSKNEQAKWAREIDDLKKSISSDTTNSIVKAASKIKLLAFLVPPHGRANKHVKTTVVDVYQSIVYHVKTADAVDDAVISRSQKMKELNKNLQPLIVVVGDDWDHLNEVICCVNNIRWKVDNFMTAFDVIFKTFFTFELQFPFESEVHYGLIQKLVYDLEKPLHPEAIGLVSDVSSIPNSQNINYTPAVEPRNREDVEHVNEVVDEINNNNAEKAREQENVGTLNGPSVNQIDNNNENRTI